jgi:hypothetical protein
VRINVSCCTRSDKLSAQNESGPNHDGERSWLSPNHNVMTRGSVVMAARSLSPKQAAERILRHRHAVIVLARQSAKKAIQAQIRAQGDKLTQVPATAISIFADAYFDVHRQRLMAEAEHAIATWPGFARCRLPGANITTNAQTQEQPKSTTSTVQISCSK